jgi:hypothetical protein
MTTTQNKWVYSAPISAIQTTKLLILLVLPDCKCVVIMCVA